MFGIHIGGLQGSTSDAIVLLVLIVLTVLVLLIVWRISHRDLSGRVRAVQASPLRA